MDTQEQFPHATQWEALSEHDLSFNRSIDGHLTAILDRLVAFHACREGAAPSQRRVLTETAATDGKRKNLIVRMHSVESVGTVDIFLDT